MTGQTGRMQFLFTRPHPLAEQLAGHEVVFKEVDDYYDPEDTDPIGRDYPLKRFLNQIDPDVLVLVDLGRVFYAKAAVLKWLNRRKKIVLGIADRKGSRRIRGCTVGAQHCSVLVTADPLLAQENTVNGRTVLWTGSAEPVFAALEHIRTRTKYTRDSPRPWQ